MITLLNCSAETLLQYLRKKKKKKATCLNLIIFFFLFQEHLPLQNGHIYTKLRIIVSLPCFRISYS